MSITSKPELVKDGNGKISYVFKFLENLDLKYKVELNDKNIDKTTTHQNLIDLLPLTSKKDELYLKFLEKFIDETRQYFSKKYTVETFNKILIHSVKCVIRDKEDSLDNFKALDTLIFYPNSMIFMNQSINLLWTVEHKIFSETILITLPDIQESNDSDKLIEINDFNEFKEDLNNEMPYEQLSREATLSKVREARLKAKLAYIRAQISTDNYLKKYGGSPDDFEDSDFDDETDDEDESQSQNEESSE